MGEGISPSRQGTTPPRWNDPGRCVAAVTVAVGVCIDHLHSTCIERGWDAGRPVSRPLTQSDPSEHLLENGLTTIPFSGIIASTTVPRDRSQIASLLATSVGHVYRQTGLVPRLPANRAVANQVNHCSRFLRDNSQKVLAIVDRKEGRSWAELCRPPRRRFTTNTTYKEGMPRERHGGRSLQCRLSGSQRSPRIGRAGLDPTMLQGENNG